MQTQKMTTVNKFTDYKGDNKGFFFLFFFFTARRLICMSRKHRQSIVHEEELIDLSRHARLFALAGVCR